LDLCIEVPISIADALIGGVAHVPTTSGEVELTIPPGTDAGRRMRLRGRGLTDGAGQTGDLYALMKIVVPKVALSPEEQSMLRAIAARGGNPV
jgi:curved DNA-binding protein